MGTSKEVGLDDFARANQRHWDKCVKDGAGCTIPWLDLDADLLSRYAGGELDSLSEVLVARGFSEKFPGYALRDVEGKDVLCLGAGGGQQSAVFGLLGAHVTVVDLCQGQLEGDEKAAKHYGYEIGTIHADMRDLSRLESESFDLIYATGTCYVPSLRQVYAGISRVTRSGGLVRTDVNNPALEFVAWDGEGYRITKPYCEVTDHREDGASEFRHYVDEAIGGLADAGFSIQMVVDVARDGPPPDDAAPGSWRHLEAYVGVAPWVIIATKDLTPL